MAGMVHCVFNCRHTMPSTTTTTSFLCWSQKKITVSHRKSNYFAFRPDKLFKEKESPSATSTCLHLRSILRCYTTSTGDHKRKLPRQPKELWKSERRTPQTQTGVWGILILTDLFCPSVAFLKLSSTYNLDEGVSLTRLYLEKVPSIWIFVLGSSTTQLDFLNYYFAWNIQSKKMKVIFWGVICIWFLTTLEWVALTQGYAAYRIFFFWL